MAQQPLEGQDLLIIEVSRSHSDTPHSVGLLCTSDQPDVGTLSANTQQSQETGIQAPGGIRTRNPIKSEGPQTTPKGVHTRTSLASESGWARVPMSQTRPCVECH